MKKVISEAFQKVNNSNKISKKNNSIIDTIIISKISP